MSKRTLITLTVAGLALGACGDDDKSAAKAPANATETAAAAGTYGVYTREVTKTDIERTMARRNDAPGFEPAPAGRYQLTIAQGDGADIVKVSDPEGFSIEMDAKVDGDALRLVSYVAPEQGAFCDPAIAANASYTLAEQDGAIALEAAEDECADRDSVLTGTWKKG